MSRAIESAPSLSVEGLKKAEIQKMEEHELYYQTAGNKADTYEEKVCSGCRRHVHVFFAHAESADTSKGFCYH